MRWPGQGRTSGGEPRQQTQPRLNSRKSSASRRGRALQARLAATDGSHRQWSCTACRPIQVSNARIALSAREPNAYADPATLAKQHPTQRWRSLQGTTSDNKTGGCEGCPRCNRLTVLMRGGVMIRGGPRRRDAMCTAGTGEHLSGLGRHAARHVGHRKSRTLATRWATHPRCKACPHEGQWKGVSGP